MMHSATKRISVEAMLIAGALSLAYLENMLPFISIIPGMKIGLANIVIFFALYMLGIKSAVRISLIRILIVVLLSANYITGAFSLAGAILSLLVMAILKHFHFGLALCSICGALAHNVGQIGVAYCLLGSAYIFAYLPVLMLLSLGSGLLVGIISSLLIKRLSLTDFLGNF